MSKSKPRTELQRTIDDILTAKINGEPEARIFILKHIALLSRWIHSRFNQQNAEQLVQVYIKGNAALKLYRMNEVVPNDDNKLDLDWSDFDNQIIINPYLPKCWWYEILGQIHKRVKYEVLPDARDGFEISAKQTHAPKKVLKIKGNVKVTIKKKAPDPDQVPTYKAGNILASCRFTHKELVDGFKDPNYGNTFKDLGDELTLTHAIKMQSNVMLCTSSEYLHPHNSLDNIRTIFSLPNEDLDFMSSKDVHTHANHFYPPAVHVLKDFRGKKEKADTSIWINTSIGKFLLYRLIVRYKHPGLGFEGNAVRTDVNEESVKFRGEIIDISIPRRESEETLHQWTRFADNIKPLKPENYYYKALKEDNFKKHIYTPDWAYQLEENINMINEVFINTSGSPHKFYKRLDRAKAALTNIPPKQPAQLANLNHLATSINGIQNQPANSNFLIQLADIFTHDYREDLLTDDVSKDINDLLPSVEQKKLKFSPEIVKWRTEFKVKTGNGNLKLADTIIQDKVKQDDQEAIKQLLMLNKIGKQVHDTIEEHYAITPDHLALLNTLRTSLEKVNSPDKNDGVKCYFDGVLSSKLDLHFRYKLPWDAKYCLPYIPLYLFGHQPGDRIKELQLDQNWNIQEGDNHFDFYLTNKNLKVFPHVVALKFIDSAAKIDKPDESKLEKLLVEQHIASQQIASCLEQMLNDGFVAIADTKASLENAKSSQECVMTLYGLFMGLKAEVFKPSQNANLIFAPEDLLYVWRVIKSFSDDFDNAIKDNLYQTDDKLKQLKQKLLKLKQQLDPANYKVKDNVFGPIHNYFTYIENAGIGNLSIDNYKPDTKQSTDDWQGWLNNADSKLRTELATLAKVNKNQFIPLLYGHASNDRLIEADKNQYRVLRDHFISDDINHRIANAMDFHLVHWLDTTRINYKRIAVNFRTTVSRLAAPNNH